MDFLRRCPSCGRRFTVKVDKKELMEKEQDTVKVVRSIAVPKITMGGVIPAGR